MGSGIMSIDLQQVTMFASMVFDYNPATRVVRPHIRSSSVRFGGLKLRLSTLNRLNPFSRLLHNEVRRSMHDKFSQIFADTVTSTLNRVLHTTVEYTGSVSNQTLHPVIINAPKIRGRQGLWVNVALVDTLPSA